MGSQVTDYTFTIIEDGQVPLAGNFDTVNYSPVIAAVIFCLMLLVIVAYTMWYLSHSERIRIFANDSRDVFAKYYFHPAKLIRDERELEFSLVSISEDE